MSTSSRPDAKTQGKYEKTGTQSKGGGTLGTDISKESGTLSMGPPKVHTKLARLASQTTDTTKDLLAICGLAKQGNEEADIRRLLLKQRSLGSTEKSAERKHFYAISGFGLAPAETTIPICRVVNGTSSDQRLTNTIGVKHVTARFVIQRLPTGPSTVAAANPVLRYIFWRDKIPATPGTAPTILATDTLPPTSATCIFSRLGNSNVIHNSTAVFNPVTAMDYHIYEVRTVPLNDKSTYDYTTPATAFGLAAPQKWHIEHKINLNNVRQNYATPAATAPDVNDLYFTAFVDMDYSTQGYQDYLDYTFDTEFEDLQDG